jgi:putative sigma-54 modulation protein
MDIIIQSLGFTAGAGLEDFVREKLGKLEKGDSKIVRANVTLFIGPKSAAENNYCEIRLEIPGNDLFVKRNEDSFEKAVVATVDALQTTLRRTREKTISRQQSGITDN